jgi:hypothetical protein
MAGLPVRRRGVRQAQLSLSKKSDGPEPGSGSQSVMAGA